MERILLIVHSGKRLLLAGCLALLGCSLAPTAVAKTIYVASDGNDVYEGTQARPVATPQHALDMAMAGDTIFLRTGRYTINHFLWVDKPNLTFASYPKERATIVSGSDESSRSAQSMIIIVANNVSIINLDFDGGTYYGIKVDLDKESASRNVSIRGCRIQNTGRDCIKTFNADNLLIEDCEIGPSGVRDPSNAEGIDSIGSVGIIIRHCYVHDAATTGIYLKGGARDGIVERNRVERCGHAGILLGQDTDLESMRDATKFEALNCVAQNNIITDIQYAGIGSYSGNNIRFANNTLYDVAKKGQAGFYVVTNGREVAAQKITFKNNVVVVKSDRPVVFLKDLADLPVCDANIYYSVNGGKTFKRESKTTYDEWDFADWKGAMKLDSHSFFTDPLLDAAMLFKPRPNSPAIDRGETLPDVKTDFSGTPRPQGKGYDIGAHEGKSDGTPTQFSEGEATTTGDAGGVGKNGLLTIGLIVLGSGLLFTAILLVRSKFYLSSRQRPERNSLKEFE